jgi:hypothetical protein
VNGTIGVVNDTLTFSHTTRFAANTTYNVTVSTAARSVYGDNLAADFSFSFTTAPPPTVVLTSPANGTAGVSLAAPIIVRFDTTMDPTSTSSSFSIAPAVNGTATVLGANLTFTHLGPFAPSTSYTVTLSTAATSAAGANLEQNYTFEFTTQAPLVKSVAIVDPPGFALWYTGERRNISWVSVNAGAGAKVDLFINTTVGGEQPLAGDLPASGTFAWTIPATVLGLGTIRAMLRDPGPVANGTATVLILPTFLVLVNPLTATVELGQRQMFMATAISLTGTPIPQDQVAFVWQFSNASVGTVDPMFGRYTNLTAVGIGTGTMTCIGIYNSAISTGLPATVTVVAPPPPTIEILSPLGGDGFASGSEIEVRWRANASLFPLELDVEYSLDNGTTFSTLVRGLDQPKAGEGSVKWKTPLDLETTTAKVRVTAVDPARSNATNTSGAFSILTPVELRAYSTLEPQGTVDRDLRDLSVAGVVSRSGRMVPGVGIKWSFLAHPDGATLYTLNVSRNDTDRFGFATARIHLGDLKGEYLVQAEADIPTLLPVVFTATARPGPPDVVFIEPQSATVPRTGKQAFTITAYDAYTNRIDDANASWTVAGGIGVVDVSGVFTAERVGRGKVVASLQGETGPVSAEAEVQVVEAGISPEALPIVLLALLLPLLVLLLLFRRKIARALWGAPGRNRPKGGEPVPEEDSSEPAPLPLKEKGEPKRVEQPPGKPGSEESAKIEKAQKPKGTAPAAAAPSSKSPPAPRRPVKDNVKPIEPREPKAGKPGK